MNGALFLLLRLKGGKINVRIRCWMSKHFENQHPSARVKNAREIWAVLNQ